MAFTPTSYCHRSKATVLLAWSRRHTSSSLKQLVAAFGKLGAQGFSLLLKVVAAPSHAVQLSLMCFAETPLFTPHAMLLQQCCAFLQPLSDHSCQLDVLRLPINFTQSADPYCLQHVS